MTPPRPFSVERADGLDAAAWNAASPDHLKGPDGKWADLVSLLARAGDAYVRHPGHEPQSVHGNRPGKKIFKALEVAKSAPAVMAKPRRPKPAKPAGRPRLLTPAASAELQRRMTADAPWSEEQREALVDYSANEYLHMNALLRGVTPRAFGQWITDEDPEATKRRIKNANAALRPLPQPIRVFRNTTAEGLGLSKSYRREDEVANLRRLVGTKMQERGLSSTSAKRLKAGKFGTIRLDYEVPAGVRAAYIESITTQKRKGEQEWVLEAGLHHEWLDLDDSGDLPTLKVRVSRP